MPDIIIDPEFKALIPPLSEDEYNNLEQSLIKDGCRDSLVLWGGVLIDGHNRYEICTKNNISFDIINKEFPSRSDAIIWIIDNQQGRRNINELTNSFLIGKRYNTEKLTNGSHTGSNFGKKLYGNTTASGLSVANGSNKARSSAIYNEKFALALESIESKTGIPKYEFLLGNIKTTMRDIIDLNKLDPEQITRIIASAKENNISIKDANSKIKKERQKNVNAKKKNAKKKKKND